MPESGPETGGAETAGRVRDLLWARELDIYAARGRGDLSTYASHVTETYLAWPPQQARPLDAAAFRRQVAHFAATDAEALDMTLTGFSLDGDTALLFHETHRTRLPDGRPADERFEVAHIWLRRDANWRLFGGMARRAPARDVYPQGE